MKKLSNILILGVVAVFITSCGMPKNMQKTKEKFLKNQSRYKEAVALVRQGKTKKQGTVTKISEPGYNDLTLWNIGIDVSTNKGLMVQFMPVDIYYVVVYAESKEALTTAPILQDGSISRYKLGVDNWYFGVRDWN